MAGILEGLNEVPDCETFPQLLDILMAQSRATGAAAAPPSGLNRIGQFLFAVPLRFFGAAVGWTLNHLPDKISFRFHNIVFAKLASPVHCPFNPGTEPLRACEQLHRDLKAMDGREPAILCLNSHPEVTELDDKLNFELIRHASLLISHLRGRATAPHLLVALDPFALAERPWQEEALYTGFMGMHHLGLNRMASLGSASYASAGHRVIQWLKSRGELIMMIGGGIAETGRLLYSTREFLWKMHRMSKRPLQDALKLDNEVKNAWRLLESWAFRELIRPEKAGAKGYSALGVVPEELKDALWTLSRALEIPKPKFEHILSRYEEEFARSTPYRERLFHNLALRLVNRGTPVLILSLIHRSHGLEAAKVLLQAPIALVPGKDKSVHFLAYDHGERREVVQSVEDFARQFITERFP